MPTQVTTKWKCGVCDWEGSEYMVEKCEHRHRQTLKMLGSLIAGPDAPSLYGKARDRFKREGVELAMGYLHHYATRTNGKSTPAQKDACLVVKDLFDNDPAFNSLFPDEDA